MTTGLITGTLTSANERDRGFSESRPREFHIRHDAGEDRPNPLGPPIIIAPMRDQLGLIVKSKRRQWTSS